MVGLPGLGGGIRRGLEDVVAYALANPLYAAGAAIALGLVVFALFRLVRWYRRPVGSTLQRLAARAGTVAVLTHPNPDPDAMASAVGVAQLVDLAGATAAIQYPGEIRHQENRAFRTVLDLDLACVETAGDLASDTVVLVDHNDPRGFEGCDGVEPAAVIDHHPGAGTGSTITDVRTDYGAAATIVTEYLQSLGLVATDDPASVADPLPQDVATALLYGILSDTAHLTKGASPAEFEAAAYLSTGIDEDVLDRIANPEVDAEVLDVKARAITERRVEGPFAVSHVGDVSNVDAIPQAADELLHLEGVTAVVVSGENAGTIHLSGRSRDDRVHMGQILETAIESIPMSGGGGHARMGGGQISADHMAGIGPSAGLTMDDLHDRLIAAMTGEA
jgi:nanoRNase/pAp phosphatase (c-di-AMP/oligoRNAs hydrolase)